MSKPSYATSLADVLTRSDAAATQLTTRKQAAEILRQQHALIGELVDALGEMLSGAYHDVPAVRARRAKAYAAISKAKEQQ